jgi:hypothetical protein
MTVPTDCEADYTLEPCVACGCESFFGPAEVWNRWGVLYLYVQCQRCGALQLLRRD